MSADERLRPARRPDSTAPGADPPAGHGAATGGPG